jgi:hypothetical protein
MEGVFLREFREFSQIEFALIRAIRVASFCFFPGAICFKLRAWGWR